MMKKVFAAILSIVLITGVSACGEKKNEGPDYADDEAMSIIAEGFSKRSDLIDKLKGQGKDTSESKYFQQIIQTEIDNDKPLKARQFKDSKLQEQVIVYLNSLDDQLAVVKKYASTSAESAEARSKAYDKRSTILKTFVDKYGLKVDSKYQDTLDDLVRNGNSVQEKNETDQTINSLIASAKFDKTEAEYGGYYTYSAVIENTSKINFSNVSLLLALYDADGVKVEEAYASTSSWAAGEKVRFEAGSDVNAAQVKVSVSGYEVAK